MAFRNVVPGIPVQVSASLSDINSLAVSTFDSVHFCLYVARLIFVVDVGQYMSFTSP